MVKKYFKDYKYHTSLFIDSLKPEPRFQKVAQMSFIWSADHYRPLKTTSDRAWKRRKSYQIKPTYIRIIVLLLRSLYWLLRSVQNTIGLQYSRLFSVKAFSHNSTHTCTICTPYCICHIQINDVSVQQSSGSLYQFEKSTNYKCTNRSTNF